ncbi:MAG: family 43 glycosylhydrolase [Candidatus Promineofilum sp.]|nr:family 43 glycosylhydrolase [Promineifilum sp.]
MLRYLNPVFPHDFPDPFVLKYCGEYWAYCSGLRSDGGAFGILRSRDLVNWQEVGSAMPPLPGGYSCYWAPEAIVENGIVYLYYSVGDEATMQIRVAVAESPAGPFVDSGHRLTQEPFAIDAHVFTAPDGRRYLFYATDYLEHERIGTGTAVDEMVDLFTLAGRPRPVSRARYDWQIYDPQRAEKGGVRWHTIEGPFVLTRKGLFYQMCSGGNWQNPSYGVGYATTATLDGPDEWQQACDGESVMPVAHPGSRGLGAGRTAGAGGVAWPGRGLLLRPRQGTACLVRGRWTRWRGGWGRQAVHVEPDAGQTAALTSEIGPLPFLCGQCPAQEGGVGRVVRSGALVWPWRAAPLVYLPVFVSAFTCLLRLRPVGSCVASSPCGVALCATASLRPQWAEDNRGWRWGWGGMARSSWADEGGAGADN